MRPNHVILSLLAVALWGCNFVFVMFALHDLPPYLLCVLRFFLTAIPAVFFFPKPKAPIQHIFIYGLFTFALQFAFLFAGLHLGMPPGLSSLVFQCQVFFSLLLASFFLKEHPSVLQLLGAGVSFIGLGLAWVNYTEHAPSIGFILVIAAALSMGVGNLFSRKLAHSNPLALIAWGSLMALPPLILTSLYLEGPELILSSLSNMSWSTIASLAFIAYGSTWLGYGIWNNMLRLYPVAMVIPFALLVPFFGMLSSYLIFNESMQAWKLYAALFILGGLAINIFGDLWITRRQQALGASKLGACPK